MHFKLIIFVFILSINIHAQVSAAVTFGKCADLIKNFPDLKPYSVSEKGFFTSEEISFLESLFNKPHELRDSHNPVYSNPFYLRFFVTEKNEIELIDKSKNIHSADYAKLLDIANKLLQQSLYSAHNNPLLKHEVLTNKRIYVSLYTIRYHLQAGHRYKGLQFHKDHADIQSIVVINRPKQLVGGHTHFAWPKVKLKAGDYFNKPKISKFWHPEVEANSLLVFDGKYTLHGVSAFNTENFSQNQTQYRDLIGLLIRLDK